MSNGLLGMVGQSMSGSRPSKTPVVYSYPPGSYTFIVPEIGKYRFIVRGGGGGGGSGGAGQGGSSGALIIATRYLVPNQQIPLVVAPSQTGNGAGSASTVTFAPNDILTAGGGGEGFTPGPAGVATSSNPADLLLNGSLANTAGRGNNGGAAGGVGSGGSSPGQDGYRGAVGATATNAPGGPGVGGGAGLFTSGGGEILIHQVSMSF